MRITNNLLIQNMLWNMNNNLVSMNEQQTQLATGKRISKPSDDPVGTTRVIKVKSDIAENEQYKENVSDAQSWLDVSENSLMDTKDILQRIRELAVQGANDTYTDEETDKIANEVNQLLEELIVNANSTMAGRYLFSGFKTDTELMNEDGTYKLDITSEKLSDFEAIAYEIAVGEYLEVGTNYLDVYGIVQNDTALMDAFIFDTKSTGNVQYAEATGDAATHSKAQFPFNYKQDLQAATTEVTLDGVTYTLEASKLTGRITQSEFIEILSDAKQTLPAPPGPPAPTPTLGDVAEVYYVASDDPTNTAGELVIEAKAFGPIVIDISNMIPAATTLSYDAALPEVVNGVAESVPVHGKIEGYFDYSVNLTSDKDLAFTMGGITYKVDTSEFDGTLTEADFLELIDNASDSAGNLLKDFVNVNFASKFGTVGVLTLETKVPSTSTTLIKDNGNAFPDFPKVTAGVDGDAGVRARIKGGIDITQDISGSAVGDLSFTIAGKTYSVDTSTMDGTLTSDQVLTLIENAKDASGNLLKDAAEVTYVNVSNPYELVIEARTPADEVPELVDNSALFVTGPYLREGQAIEENASSVNAKLEGPIDLTKDISAGAADSLSFTFGDETYTVNVSTMDGTLSEEDFLNVIEAASDGLGGTLSDIAYVSFGNDANPYNLIIEAKNPDSYSPSAVDANGLYMGGTTLTDGVADIDPVTTKITGTLDIEKDITGATLSYAIGGEVYTVDTSTMDGTLTLNDIQSLIENAPGGGGGILSDVATVTVNTTLNPYEFIIEAKDALDDTTVEIIDTGNIYVKSPYTIGVGTVEPIKAKIEGTFDYSVDISGESLTYTVDGTTYTADLSSMDGTLTEAEFLEVLKNASDGSDGKLSDWMTVSFSSVSGTTGTLTIEQKTGADAVVSAGGTVVTTPTGYSVAPTLTDGVDGVIDTKAIVTGTAKITDEMLSDPVTGVGTQSFVITYNGETERIDIDLSEINTTEELKAAIDLELKTTFGDDGGSPPINNVTFDVVFDGSNDVIQFTAAGRDDGSQVSLKVDVIVSSKPKLMKDIEDFTTALTNKDDEGINEFIGKLDEHLDNVLSVLAGIGAKTNRLDFVENRIDDNNLSMTEILSKVQDIDYAAVTIKFKSLESIYKASLSVGAKVIQPTLIDFLS
ncbi:MAG: flagellar hook-associated protein FlgL [Clostridia bacterium]|nr:flagellar hook-associated protein FlgL [Clostridia bacterium]